MQPVADLSNKPGAVYSIGELFSDYSQEPQNHAEKVAQPAMTLKMKSFFHAGCLAIPAIIMASQASSRAAGFHMVKGFMRRSGTFVMPHFQTNPDRDRYNNWSTVGNVNPFTGKPGTVSPNGRASPPLSILPPAGGGLLPPKSLNSHDPNLGIATKNGLGVNVPFYENNVTYPYLVPPDGMLKGAANPTMPFAMFQDARANVIRARKDGGMVGEQTLVSKCYAGTSIRVLCMLEDLGAYQSDLSFRRFFKEGVILPPTVEYFSEANTHARLMKWSGGIFSGPTEFWRFYANAPMLVWLPYGTLKTDNDKEPH